MTNDELVNMYVTGCDEAFDELLFRHKDKLYKYIAYHFNNQPDVIDDVFQETFVKVIMTLKQGQYVESGHFFSWITRIAHNIIVDQFRSQNLMPIADADDNDIDYLTNKQLVDSAHESQIINEQTLCDVKRLMEHLPDVQREVVFMRYYQNLSFKEIADATGVSINTSLGRMRYALINMRKMAQDHGISLEML